MLDFKKAELDDLPLLRTYFAQANGRLCDETPGVFFMWRNHYAGSYAIRDGQLFLRYEAELGTEDTAFAILSGAPVEPGIRAIREHCREQKLPVIISTVSEETLEELRARFTILEAEQNDDWSDYLYDAANMIELKGSSFGGQRNHIHQFRRKFPDAFCAVIDEKNLAEAKQFLIDYESLAPLKTEQAHQELHMTLDILDHYALFGMDGLLLYTEPGKICGLSLGENLGDTMYIHVEKALRDVPGCYPALTNQYARHFITPEIRYINREEDLGEPGLRRSKQSYHPVKMLKKYLLTLA